MKRHSSLVPFSREHHGTLILAQVIKKGAPNYRGMPTSIEGKKEAVLSHFNSQLKAHFNREEKLFDKMSSKFSEVDELTMQLKNEHRQIESLVEKISANESPEENLHQLGILLESHIRKEERQLFELIPQKFDDSFLASIDL